MEITQAPSERGATSQREPGILRGQSCVATECLFGLDTSFGMVSVGETGLC